MLMLGTPGRIRTCDLELRSLLLYPAELPGLRRNLRAYLVLSIRQKLRLSTRLLLSILPESAKARPDKIVKLRAPES